MRAVLTAEIPVTRVAVFAEMAWLERRPELGLLCRAARGQGRRITQATVEEVLPGLAEAGARNVIAWCATLGLCDKQGSLTTLGDEVAERDEAPVPEQGVYGLWLAHHPVLGRRVLAVERLSSTREQLLDQVRPLALEPDRGRVFRSTLEGRERFLVRDLPTNHGVPAGIPGETNASCRLVWTLDFEQGRNHWTLDGQIEAPRGRGRDELRPLQHEPESEALDLRGLADTWGAGVLQPLGRWQPRQRRLAVPFVGLEEGEIEGFRKTVELKQVEVPGKGAYANVTLRDLPIGPASAKDAQQWALDRFDRRLAAKAAYRGRAELRSLFVGLVEGTPLEVHTPTLPAHDELLARAVKDPERFWSLSAPVDLAPTPLTEPLGPFQVDAATQAPDVETPDVVRVPHGAEWSMQALVDRLCAGSAPKRVLLCDRYVRGDENLETLRVLVATLRSYRPDLPLEVWTGEEEADFGRIQALSGAPALGYREVFGRAPPHDRYLLVSPERGAGFGWQMSNSPLVARSQVSNAGPATQLRWKDLVATRVTAEELEPRFRTWLGRGGR